jgi:hypothetical protein
MDDEQLAALRRVLATAHFDLESRQWILRACPFDLAALERPIAPARVPKGDRS